MDVSLLAGSQLGRLAAFASGLAVLALLERLIPFRAPSTGAPRRWAVNLSLGAANSIVLSGIVRLLPSGSTPGHRGVFQLAALDRAGSVVRFLISLLVFDLVLWAWHVANHRIAWLWRFHRVHHTERDLDVTTASRFHVGELLPGHAVTALAVLLLGADARLAAGCHMLTSFLSQLQHANVRWPRRLEAFYSLILVPPSLHAIHHSCRIEESLSNFGTAFSLWDRVAGTLRTTPCRGDVIAGLDDAVERDLPALLLLPLRPPGSRAEPADLVRLPTATTPSLSRASSPRSASRSSRAAT